MTCRCGALRAVGARSAFTIVELLVALGLTLVLVVGIGRIFTISKDTMSIGEANAEISQAARGIERIMREDFRNMTREGFIGIRCERLGLASANERTPGALSGENQRTAIYYDKDAQEKGQNLLRYPVGQPDDDDYDPGRPVVRMDQIVFFAAGDYSSYQYSNAGSNTIARNLTAGAAKIWYGHAPRASVAAQIDQTNNRSFPVEVKDSTTPPGLGDYVTRFADDGQGSNPIEDNANYYGKDWILGRQAALLLPRDSTTNNNFHFAQSFSEYYNESGAREYTNYYGATDTNGNFYFRINGYNGYDANGWKHRLSPGFVDLIDMDLAEVQKAVTEYGSLYNPLTSEIDLVEDPLGPSWAVWQEQLWVPSAIGTTTGIATRTTGFTAPAADADDKLSGNDVPVLQYVTDPDDRDGIGTDVAELWAMQQRGRMVTALGRMRAETTLPTLSRQDQMLTQASLGVGVTNFEVAWSTGEISYPEGEIVWYDIENPANPYFQNRLLGVDLEEARRNAPADPRTWYLSEVTNQQLPAGGAFQELQRSDLYYATFGYFVPKAGDSERAEAWPWPTMIRVRMTLHDQNNRLPEGRTFEFVFNLPPQERAGT